MLLGQGVRKLGEACWTHAQCFRSQPHAHCKGLVCTCDSGFHNTDGKCTRHMWEDLGLVPWEIIVFSLVFTVSAFAIFVGCVYFVVSKLVRFARTRPAETLIPNKSFKGDPRGLKAQNSVMERRPSARLPKIYETKLTEDSTVESQLVDETAIRFSDTLDLGNNLSDTNHRDSISTTSTSFMFEPARFITPLDYRSSDSADTRQSSRRSSSTQSAMSQPRCFRTQRLMRAWSTATSHDDSDDWFQPNRNHLRMAGPNSPGGATRLPLLLRASTFSESDESP
ncbi:uncharacterized protein [Macrobrachium rosenbergii]|uniref:uncharacterized protein n=1 Tax=Macrobrachium rosenbergii TaxID=79674 RepID=UPI0034D423FB